MENLCILMLTFSDKEMYMKEDENNESSLCIEDFITYTIKIKCRCL